MNCQDLERRIPEWARSGEGAQEPGVEALAHLRECSRCGEALEQQRRLTEELAALAMTSRQEQASARVEERLRAAFRQQHAVPPRPRRLRRAWFLAPAAGLAAAAILLFRGIPAPQTASRVVPAVSNPIPVLKEQAEAPKLAVIATNQTARTVRKPAAHQRPAPKEPSAIDNRMAFLPVLQGDGWTPLDGAKVMRVELPGSALRFFGLPAPEGNGLERVQADVMLSDDGLVRGVRFVSFRQ